MATDIEYKEYLKAMMDDLMDAMEEGDLERAQEIIEQTAYDDGEVVTFDLVEDEDEETWALLARFHLADVANFLISTAQADDPNEMLYVSQRIADIFDFVMSLSPPAREPFLFEPDKFFASTWGGTDYPSTLLETLEVFAAEAERCDNAHVRDNVGGLLVATSELFRDRGDLEAAIDAAQRAVEHFRASANMGSVQERMRLAWGLATLGHYLDAAGRPDETIFAEAVDQVRQAAMLPAGGRWFGGDEWDQVMTYYEAFLRSHGRPEEAETLRERFPAPRT